MAEAPFSDAADVGASTNARVQRSRARILQASVELIVEEGARALTVDAIAERSGVAKSTLYRHWRSIDALILDVFRAAVPGPYAPDPNATFEQALRAHVTGMARSLADPCLVKLLPDLMALRQQHPGLRELADADRAQKEATLAAILARGATEGRVPADLDIGAVVAVLYGPMLMCALFGEPERVEAVGAYSVDRFLDSYRR